MHGLDDNVLNPAIKAVVETVLGAVGKSEEIIKPILMTVLQPLGLIQSEDQTTSSKTEANPEVTYASSVAAK